LEVNGKVLIVASPDSAKQKGQYFFEYTPGTDGSAGTIASLPFPSGSIDNNFTDYCSMLDLPNGQILFTNAYNLGWFYTPASGPNSSWAPTISGLGINPDTSYNIAVTQFNGMSATTGYGDDLSNATNYPLVQFTSGSNVYYGRTFDPSSMGVATGSLPTTTNFTLPSNLPPGSYNLDVVANGIQSSPITFDTGIYVNQAWTGSQIGTQPDPFVTVTQAADVAPGNSAPSSASFIFITGGTYSEDLTISTPCSLIDNGGGAVTIGTS
jgi:hypothetical protein